MNRPLTLAALSLPLSCAVAVADSAITTLDPIVVTATRTETPQTATLASVSVIDRAGIERSQAQSVPELLRGLPGVILSQSGGRGKATGVFIRGTNSDHVLVLVDGVKIGSATMGGVTSLQDLPIDQIERIEVVRGPRSSLYGSEAVGGVIQIFTKRGGGNLTPRASVGIGSFDSASAAAGLSGGGERGWFNLSGNVEGTQGFNACDGSPSPRAGCRVNEPDRDGYRNQGLSARAGYAFSDALSVDFHLLSADSENEYDGDASYGNLARNELRILGANATVKPLDIWTLKLAAGYSLDRSRTFYDKPEDGYDDVFFNRYQTERTTLSLQNDFNLTPSQLLTLGVDYQNDRVDAENVEYSEDSRDNLGIFGEYQGVFGPTDLVLSLRQEDNQQFGDHTTGNAALGYLFENDIQVKLSWGTAFRAPTFNELYYPSNFYYNSNPELDPERSRNLELGFGGPVNFGPMRFGRWDLSLYRIDIDDLIVYDSATYTVDNIDSARINGLDAAFSTQVLDWDLRATLTLLDHHNRSDDEDDGNLLPRRPEQAFQIDLDRRFERWAAGATLYVAGRRFDDLANAVRLDGYTLVDLRAEYFLSPALRVQARLENLFDEDYETAYLYNQPGRAFYLTLRYEP